MTATGKKVMDQWIQEEKQITVYFRDKQTLTGKLIDYDEEEIVLECQRGYTYVGKPPETAICRNWMCIEAAPPASRHD